MNTVNSYLNINFYKKFKLLILLFTSLCAVKTGKLSAQVGCMDNSKHTNLRLGYDYKVPYFVKCACPCKTYEILARHGNRCSKCLHWRAPVETIIVKRG